jgi:hypothetical protein
MPDGGSRKSLVLHSWKEVAAYVGRGVRTVQRWEADCGMPVHRPRGKSRSAVLAFADEIDKWLRSDTNSALQTPELIRSAKDIEASVVSREIVQEAALLHKRCLLLCSENQRALDSLRLNVLKLTTSMEQTRNRAGRSGAPE